MENELKTDSVKDTVFEHIYNGIKNGTIKSDETLSERSLAKELNVSRTPVREAFRRLEKYGLVETEPHRGVKVITFSADRVMQLYKVREVLEGLAARGLAENPNKESIRRLEKLLTKASEAVKDEDIELLSEINSQFHSELAHSTNNLYLIDIMKTLQSHISICMTASLARTGRPFKNIEEHHLILNAIKQGDSDFAESMAKYHVRTSMENVLKNLDI